ncbi:WD40 repeat domain-containing protein [Deinococcus apachensis]|uniref:WD40 repeat domain-containing protein n=1 Tax=Deinococcus apachensis TaxID=309886 RepID=UPI0003674117|nr:WD40 repeat domain-containing protein [Deinococcus apachensis]
MPLPKLLLLALPLLLTLPAPGPLYVQPHAALLGFQGDALLVQRRREGGDLTPQVVWLDARSGQVRRSVALKGETRGSRSPTLSPDGTLLALGNGSSVSLWRLPDGEPWPFSPDSTAVHSVAFDARSRHMALGLAPGYAQLWDLHTGGRLRSFMGHGAPVSAVSVVEGRLLSAARDGTVRVWNTVTGDVLASERVPGNTSGRGVGDAVLTPNGQTYAVLTTDGEVWLGRVGKSGLTRLDVDGGRGLALNPAGDLLAVSGSSERGLAVVDLQTERVRTRLPNRSGFGQGQGVAWAPQGNLLAEQINNERGAASSDVQVRPLELPPEPAGTGVHR